MATQLVDSASDLTLSLRSPYRGAMLHEALQLTPSVLLGVSEAAALELKKIGVESIFDLATSGVFNAAHRLSDAALDPRHPLAQFGRPPTDLVHQDQIDGTALNELAFQPIKILAALTSTQAASLQAALDVATLRDLALWPPYRAAANMVDAVFFPENRATFDPEAPSDLLPKSGEYPTERVQYTTLLMDEVRSAADDPLVDIASDAFAPLNLATLAANDAGFKRIAFGALLTLNQSWFAQGVALGQLLHSTALAPGESTRIAVIDWSRKSRAGQSEVTSEVDDLTNDMSRNRSVSEVTQAVANEAQGGFSSTNSTSTTEQSGTAVAGEMSGGLVGSLIGGPSISAGHSSSSATTSGHADSYSSSWGQRDLSASMSQKVNDRTHQHAHSSRSRRASVVKEVSQTEHESVSTRVVTNYNHMHALTVQYYEVVQIFRTEVAIARAERVVFLPIAITAFDDVTIRRFRGALVRTALTSQIRDALQHLDVIELAPAPRSKFTRFDTAIDVALDSGFISQLVVSNTPDVTAPQPNPATGLTADLTVVSPRIAAINRAPVALSIAQSLWTVDQASKLSALLGQSVFTVGSASIQLPSDVVLENAAVVSAAKLGVQFSLQGGGVLTDDTLKATPLLDVAKISITGSSADRDLDAVVTLTLNRNGVRFPVELPSVRIAKGASATALVNLKSGAISADLKVHLEANRLYYHQAIMRALDAAQIAQLLSGFGIKIGDAVVPLAQVVDPVPIRYVANYLAFKMNTDAQADPAWAAWLDDHGVRLGEKKVDIVPMATGGTFAEAVLGRFNSAEKLDMTRFWNWKDSPPPIQPTEIAAIQTGSRAQAEDLKTGALSNPIINITQPAALPDPTGMVGALAAIQNGAMFRDMSGLQATVGLAQAAMQASAQGATGAGQQAGQNMATHMQNQTERMRIAADLAKSVIGAVAGGMTGLPIGALGGGSSSGSHSEDGAKVNYYDQNRSPPAPQTEAGAAPSGGGAGGGGSSGGGSAPAGPEGYSQNPAAMAATWPGGASPAALIEKVLEKTTEAGSQPSPLSDAGAPNDAGAGPSSDAGHAAGAEKTLPPVAPPSQILLPAVNNMPGPAGHPALPPDCAQNGFFGDPPTRGQPTKGKILSAAEITKRKAEVVSAISKAQARRPLSAANLQHWLGGTGATRVIAAAEFKQVDSEVPTFLANKARTKFEQGARDRLKNASHSQGSLIPSGSAINATGPVRFMQFRDGLTPSPTATAHSADLATALGGFNVHCACWVRATYKGTTGGFLGLGSKRVYDVDFLRWCVQIYDVYDWNMGATTPFPVTDAELQELPLPQGAYTITKLAAGMNMVRLKDQYFADLEVSGTGKAYLIRSETFEAPTSVTKPFTVEV